MSSFLLAAPNMAPGNVLPMLALARELCRNPEHVVHVHVGSEYADAVAALGARLLPSIGRSLTSPGTQPALASGRAEFREALHRRLLDNVANDARVVAGLLRDHSIDLVITDSLCTGTGYAAEASGLPWATLQTSPWLLTDEAIDRFPIDPAAERAAAGLAPSPLPFRRQGVSPQMQLLAWSPECDLVPAPESSIHVGALVADLREPNDEERASLAALGTRRPLILVTTTTMPWVMRDLDPAFVGEAFSGVDADVVMTKAGDGSETKPDSSIVRLSFLPHGLLFPRASLVVAHGGWGTVTRCFLEAVPVIVVPGRSPHGMPSDNPWSGRLCDRLGVGRLLDDPTPATLRANALELLGSEPTRFRARAYAARLRALRDADWVARLVDLGR